MLALVLVGLTELHGLQHWASRGVEWGVEVCRNCGPSLVLLCRLPLFSEGQTFTECAGRVCTVGVPSLQDRVDCFGACVWFPVGHLCHGIRHSWSNCLSLFVALS